MDWLDLEERFRELSEPLREVRLDIQTGAAGEHFRLAGLARAEVIVQFQALACIAGDLIQTTGGAAYERVDSASDGLTRWYRAVQELTGLQRPGPVAQQLDEQGSPAGFIFTSSVDRIAEASAALCLMLFGRRAVVSGNGAVAPQELHPSTLEELPDPKKVFVVHGRDLRLRDDFFAFLRSAGLSPIEWSEALRLTGKASPYIGEVLDAAFGKAQAIVVLLTPDDQVRLRQELHAADEAPLEKNLALQARPNVLFEAGMALARSPDRTVLVEVGPVKPFSDVAGRHVVRLGDSESRRRDLLERLQTAGCEIQIEHDEWVRTGVFQPSNLGDSEPGSGPEAGEAVRWVALEYPVDSGLQSRLEAEDFTIRWSRQDRLAQRLDREGWSLVIDEDAKGHRFLLRTRSEEGDLTLIRRRRAQTFVPNPRVIGGMSDSQLRVLLTAAQSLEQLLVAHLQAAPGLEGRSFMVQAQNSRVQVVVLPAGLSGPAESTLRFDYDPNDVVPEARRIAEAVVSKAQTGGY